MRNTTILHAEDLLLDGKEGMDDIFSFFTELQKVFSGKETKKIRTSLKWDGSPSIVCGIHPENNKFFIGTKSVFNKTPIINYNLKDIKNNHKNNRDLVKILSNLLVELPKMNINGVYQGDLLYWPSLVKKRLVNGTSYLTFKPNSITYSVDSGGELADNIRKSKFGIVFHTKYNGKRFSSLVPSYNPDISSFSKNKNIWVIDSSYNNISFLTDKEKTYISNKLKDIKKEKNNQFLDILSDTPNIKNYLTLYFNYCVREGNKSPNLNSFMNWLIYRIEDEKSKLKSSKGKEGRDEKRNLLFSFMNDHKDDFKKFFETRIIFSKIKNIFIRKIKNIKDVDTFFDINGKFKKTKPEGLVIVNDKNRVVKLIDRSEFSKNNFTISRYKK